MFLLVEQSYIQELEDIEFTLGDKPVDVPESLVGPVTVNERDYKWVSLPGECSMDFRFCGVCVETRGKCDPDLGHYQLIKGTV